MATLVGKPITENGLGTMRLTVGQHAVPEEVYFAVLKEAIAQGANVWNAADFYGTPEENSLHLMKRYFTKYPEDADKVVLCVKSGVDFSKAPSIMDGSAENMRKKVGDCLTILDGKKTLDIFGCARTDPEIPIETTVAALAMLVKEGKIGGIQLTEANAETIRRASKITKVDMVEAEVSLWSPDIFSNGVAEVCGELGIVICAHTPLGAGMLTGKLQKPEDLPENDHHRTFPRFVDGNFQANLRLVEEIRKLAANKGCTMPQLALSWIKSFNGKPGMPFILPISGARSVERVRENCTTIALDEKDRASINRILAKFPVVGRRFPEHADKYNEY